MIKFADVTTIVGLIPDSDEFIYIGQRSIYRIEVAPLAPWCSANNLELKALKTVEMRMQDTSFPFPPMK